MTKSILIINTPDRCFDCPVHQFLRGDQDECFPDVIFCNAENWRKPTTHTPILDFTKRPDWCPLRTLPQKTYAEFPDSYKYGFADGWNDCLKEITK